MLPPVAAMYRYPSKYIAAVDDSVRSACQMYAGFTIAILNIINCQAFVSKTFITIADKVT